ncbi:MAG: hypothetical protein IPP49_16420 [Saprospiraceae bacterium]|nr:hypothetical protein [Saprospiraceae bacterium]
MRNNILYSLVFFLIAISNLSFTPPNEIMRILLERLEFLTKNFPHEKVYIHTDKPHYTLGDTIWYSLTATDASIHSQKPVSGLVYVQIIGPDSSVIVQKGILLNEQHGSGEIAIDPKWKPGAYLIQAYTNYMRNYHAGYVYTKELMIWDAATDAVKSDFFLSIDSLSGASKLLKIGKVPIPSGVAQFTLFNKEGMPLCERAVFLDGGSTDVVKGDISLSYAYQNTRSKTDVVVRLKDNNSNGLKGNFSVSVFDKNNTNFNAADGDIRTFFY